MTTSLMNEDDARALLDPLMEDLRACVVFGWTTWTEREKDPSSLSLRKTTRANAVYDWIVEEAVRRFQDNDGMVLDFDRQFLTIIIDGRLMIRFKKFRNSRLGTSGVSTAQRNMLMYQQLEIDGVMITHAVVGYLLDNLETWPEMIAVACPLGKRNFWAFSLDDEIDDPNVLLLPFDGDDSDEEPTVKSSESNDEEDEKRAEEE